MEYIFGTIIRNGVRVDSLKTVGKTHSNYEGNCSITREYHDAIFTDNFSVVEKYRSEIDNDGNCYDWYVIDKHNRYIDKFTPAKEQIDTGISDAQDATCELSEELDERITDIENALCDLTNEEV